MLPEKSVALALTGSDSGGDGLSASARLESYLLGNYSAIARPVEPYSQPVTVQFDFILNQVLQVVSPFSQLSKLSSLLIL